MEYVEKKPLETQSNPFRLHPFHSIPMPIPREKLNGMMEKGKIAAVCDDLVSWGAVRTAMCSIRAAEKDKFAAARDGLISERDVQTVRCFIRATTTAKKIAEGVVFDAGDKHSRTCM
jgi:hypothetical protein